MDPFFAYFKRTRKTVSQTLNEFGGPRYKDYARFPHIPLSDPELLKKDISDTLQNRKSVRTYSQEPLSEKKVSALLNAVFGGQNERPHYPSGGATYSVETYLLLRNTQEPLRNGLFHYNPQKHVLAELKQHPEPADQLFDELFIQESSAILLFTFVKGKVFPKYGGLGYKLGLIEAGHIGQNVYLVANALGMGCCALGDGDTTAVNTLLGIDGVNECYAYGIALGNVHKSA